jgi:hypothetical protein
MKNIWIFGNSEVHDSYPFTDKLTGEDVYVKYFKFARVELNEYSLEGYNRPNVIINLQEPRESMKKRQQIVSTPLDTQIIDLWN